MRITARIILASVLAGLLAAAGYNSLKTPDDQQIVAEIQSQLFRIPELETREISVVSSEGVVTVSGQVASNEERFQVGAIVRQAEGVKQVTNMLDVVESEMGKPPASQEEGARWSENCRMWRSFAFWQEATLDDVVSCLDAGSHPMAQDQLDGTTHCIGPPCGTPTP